MVRMLLAGSLLTAAWAQTAVAQQARPGAEQLPSERLVQGGEIAGLGAVGDVEKVQSGFQFTEGPAADAAGNVYFSELREEKIYRTDLNRKTTVFLAQSRRTNGLMFDALGRMIACESGANRKPGIARVVSIDVGSKQVEVVAAGYRGKPFNRVNDLVIDKTGGVYFTDILGGEENLPQATTGVYYVAADGRVSRLVDDLDRPNGVILSPDEKTLYVLPSGSPRLVRYPIQSPGRIGAGQTHCRLPTPENGRPRGGDGLTVDVKGNLYVTVPALNYIQVVTPAGKVLGTIGFPEGPANCTFGGRDFKTLFVTARTSLYAVRMPIAGHQFTRKQGAAVGALPPGRGQWAGTWQAAGSDDCKELRCQARQVGGAAWEATFTGVCSRRFSFEVVMKGREADGEITFSGTTDLGKDNGGMFVWDGRIVDERFTGTYRSTGGKKGTFTMLPARQDTLPEPTKGSKDAPSKLQLPATQPDTR